MFDFCRFLSKRIVGIFIVGTYHHTELFFYIFATIGDDDALVAPVYLLPRQVVDGSVGIL